MSGWAGGQEVSGKTFVQAVSRKPYPVGSLYLEGTMVRGWGVGGGG